MCRFSVYLRAKICRQCGHLAGCRLLELVLKMIGLGKDFEGEKMRGRPGPRVLFLVLVVEVSEMLFEVEFAFEEFATVGVEFLGSF